ELLRLLDLDTTALVLDFTDVTFCDSQGIGALMAVRRRATEVGARLDVINVQSIVMRVMEVTGVVDALRARPA
ncbi:MAG TPA: STAS domain-containing protein, partial [Micromonosporaceae bacterium]|nr:STAS domain-containing protein [Micromonosporaceae bacterium]